MAKQKITTCLWFDGKAEEAAKFYTSVFKNSKINNVTHYGESTPWGEPGSVLTVTFELDGQELMALNGGPEFKFSEAVSLIINCDGQGEVDYFWEKLTSDGGEESMCGWLKDKYGVSWQIVPTELDEMMSGDPKKADQMMKALLEMRKLDIAKLREAYDGG